VPTPTDGNRELLTVIAFMRAAPGKREELKAALEALIEPTRQEDGYVNYDLHHGVEDPYLFREIGMQEIADDEPLPVAELVRYRQDNRA
jgi:Antibiotic biosynthesis monooxygenase